MPCDRVGPVVARDNLVPAGLECANGDGTRRVDQLGCVAGLSGGLDLAGVAKPEHFDLAGPVANDERLVVDEVDPVRFAESVPTRDTRDE